MLKSLIFATLLSAIFVGAEQAHSKDISINELESYKAQAKYDDKIAMQLAFAYFRGSQGVPKDRDKAEQWFKKLANNEHSSYRQEAAYLIATLYMGVENHDIDHKEAEKYFKIASIGVKKDKYNDAPYRAAMLTKNNKDYLLLLQQSANADYLPAIVELVNAYMQHQRVTENDNALVRWLRVAANKGHVEAQAMLGNLYFTGNKVYQDYERAYYYLVRAAEHNNAEAQAKLGLIYKLGLGTKKNSKKAELWFKRSYQGNNIIAGENLANLYIESKDKIKQSQGVALLKKLAEAGSKPSAQLLISIYQKGKLVIKDKKQLAHWQYLFKHNKAKEAYLIGANKNNNGEDKIYKSSSTAINLEKKGQIYFEKQDYVQAIKYLKQAALLNLPSAQFNLALTLIRQGQKLKDTSYILTAYAWAKIAKDNAQPNAQTLLDNIENAFEAQMIEQALRQYKALKKEIKK
jgi:hypothetical protein